MTNLDADEFIYSSASFSFGRDHVDDDDIDDLDTIIMNANNT